MSEIHVNDLRVGYYWDFKGNPTSIRAIYKDSIPYIVDCLKLKSGSMEYYSTNDYVDFSEIEILEAQVWIPYDNSELVEIFSAPVNNVLKVKGCSSRKEETYFIEDFLCLYYYDQIPETQPSKVEYGATCRSCQNYSEYAVKEAGYTCWACKNGYNG